MRDWEPGDPQAFDDPVAWAKLGVQADAKLKRDAIIEILPEDVTSVVDVGCGSGLLVNELPSTWRVVGVDRSEVALSFVRREAVRADATSLPFCDRGFDVVVCSEVLEHLSDSDVVRAAAELSRVADRYIVITVPNGENLWAAATRCRACGVVYNRHGHVRTFRRPGLEALFAGWTTEAYQELGPRQPYAPGWLFAARALWGREAATHDGSTCPKCGSTDVAGRPGVWDRLHGRWLRHAMHKGLGRPYWILILLRRVGP